MFVKIDLPCRFDIGEPTYLLGLEYDTFVILNLIQDPPPIPV